MNRSKPEPGKLILDCAAMTICGPSERVALSAAEVELLAAFARAPNNRLEISLITSLLGGDAGVSKAAIEVRIVRLRKKMIAAGASGKPINVVRNHGYQMSNCLELV